MTTLERRLGTQLTAEELEREWAEAWLYAQTHTPNQILRGGIRAITESLQSGEITTDQADTYLRVLLGEYVAAIATDQVTSYLERHLGARNTKWLEQTSRQKREILA